MAEKPLTDYLLRDERILWSGQPGQGLVLVPSDAFLLPFGLIWCSVTFSMFITTWNRAAPGINMLVPLMFVGIGLYFVIGRFLVDAWVRRSIRYAVTDRRILIARTRPGRNFTAVNIGQIAEVHLSERASGCGTLRFGPRASIWFGNNFFFWTPWLDPVPHFLAIDNARHVFDLVQGLRDR